MLSQKHDLTEDTGLTLLRHYWTVHQQMSSTLQQYSFY